MKITQQHYEKAYELGRRVFAKKMRPTDAKAELVATGMNASSASDLIYILKAMVLVNAYERSSAARAACLARYGHACSVCGFNFEETYGPIGKEFIHVHHLKEIALIAQAYHVDPIHDLRPVCPNCDAMLHQRKNHAYSINEIKGFLNPGS